MSREIFNIETPYVFNSHNRGLAAEVTDGIRSGEVALGELEQQKLNRINKVLHHPELDKLIAEGKITLGLIKPQVNVSKGLSSDDQAAADMLMDETEHDNVVFTFSTKLSNHDVERFYQDAKDKYPREIWDMISSHAQSGPLTFMLIYREQGDAVSWWRGRMGATHPKQADPDSIRGRHAIEENLPNNLVHGSDSILSVQREVGELRRIVMELAGRSVATRKSMFIFSEKEPKRMLGVGRGRELLAIQRVFEERGSLVVSALRAISYNPRDLDSRLLTTEPDSLSA